MALTFFFLQIKLRLWEITEFVGGHRDVWGYVTPKCMPSLCAVSEG